MNLLLLLSALLSALSGVGQAVRGACVPQAVCASVVETNVPATQRRTTTARPSQPLPRAVDAPVAILAALRLAPVEPIFAARRRE